MHACEIHTRGCHVQFAQSGNAKHGSLPQKAPSSLQTRPHLPCKEPSCTIQEPLHGRHQRRSTSARARVHTPAVVRHTPPHRHTATSRRHLDGCTSVCLRRVCTHSPRPHACTGQAAPAHKWDAPLELLDASAPQTCCKAPPKQHPNENLLGRSGI